MWSAVEKSLHEGLALPSAAFVRRALGVCWDEGLASQADELLRALIRVMPEDNELPNFKSPLNDYFIEPWLVRLGLSAVFDPQVSFGLSASAAALDFHFQVLNRRKERAGIGPAFDDPERDLREFASDPGALAESAIQIEDAEQLSLGVPDWRAMRKRSADHGQRVLEEVRVFLGHERPSDC
jgi:hypothetical protein